MSTNAEKAAALNEVAEAERLMYEVGRLAVEDVLIELRGSGIGILGRNNGLVVKHKDGSSSDIIRLTIEGALRIGMQAMAKHLAEQED